MAAIVSPDVTEVNGVPSSQHPVRILYLEDNAEDVRLTLEELSRGRIKATARTVSTIEAFRLALEEDQFDIVLADYNLKACSAVEALEALADGGPNLPLILVADFPGEETAVSGAPHGATDLIYKDRRAMLPAAVQRALEEQVLREGRLQAEMALRSANQVLTALIRCAPLPITVIGQSGTVNVWNPAAEQVLGWCREEVLGNELSKVLPGDDGGLSALLERSLDAESSSGFELRQQTKDGAWVDLRVFGAPLTDEADEIQGVIGMMTDVTERNLIIEAFRESKERFQSAFLYAPIGMAITSLDGRFLRVNPAFCHMVGYLESELLRLTWSHLVHPVDAGGVPEADAKTTCQRETRFLHKHGHVVHVHWSVSVVRDASGRPQYEIGQVVDITERKKAEETVRQAAADLERSNRDLQHFAYVASHDLQEPLRMIRGFLELLEKRYKGHIDERADEYIHYAIDGATRMQNLIRGLLAYSRVGTQGKRMAPVESGMALRQALLNLQVVINEAEAALTHDEMPVISADDVQLTQLFQNLVGNAIKFRSIAAPRIHVSVDDQDQDWAFAISDNGIGFDPQHANRIFQMFQRLQGPTEYPGTGIGLALCKRIVERHGGRIWVEAAPGEGSTFHFTIPKEVPSEP